MNRTTKSQQKVLSISLTKKAELFPKSFYLLLILVLILLLILILILLLT